jgi:hypothetical protein
VFFALLTAAKDRICLLMQLLLPVLNLILMHIKLF